MSKDELWDSVKKATKPSLDRFDNLDKQYIFYLEEMVTPKLLTIFYWILLFAFITKGIGDIFEGDFFRGLVWIVGGSLASRVACELIVVLFRINEILHEINDNTKNIDTLGNNNIEKDHLEAVAEEAPAEEAPAEEAPAEEAPAEEAPAEEAPVEAAAEEAPAEEAPAEEAPVEETPAEEKDAK